MDISKRKCKQYYSLKAFQMYINDKAFIPLNFEGASLMLALCDNLIKYL